MSHHILKGMMCVALILGSYGAYIGHPRTLIEASFGVLVLFLIVRGFSSFNLAVLNPVNLFMKDFVRAKNTVLSPAPQRKNKPPFSAALLNQKKKLKTEDHSVSNPLLHTNSTNKPIQQIKRKSYFLPISPHLRKRITKLEAPRVQPKSATETVTQLASEKTEKVETKITLTPLTKAKATKPTKVEKKLKQKSKKTNLKSDFEKRRALARWA